MSGEVFEDDLIDIEQTPASHPSHFERYRKLIDSFEEDRESPLEKLVRWLFLLLAYALPLVVAYAMGKEIGDAYGGRFDWNNGWSLGTHTVALAGEFALAMMTLSAATALRRMASDASYAPKFIGSLVAFLLFSLASGLAQKESGAGALDTPDFDLTLRFIGQHRGGTRLGQGATPGISNHRLSMQPVQFQPHLVALLLHS